MMSALQLSICTFFASHRSIIPSVVRRILTLASLICLTSLAAFYPVIEALDRWDAPGPFSDSEIQIIAVLTLVGAMFVLARLLVTAVLSFRERVVIYVRRSSPTRGEANTFRLVAMGDAGASPPLKFILRI